MRTLLIFRLKSYRQLGQVQRHVSIQLALLGAAASLIQAVHLLQLAMPIKIGLSAVWCCYLFYECITVTFHYLSHAALPTYGGDGSGRHRSSLHKFL